VTGLWIIMGAFLSSTDRIARSSRKPWNCFRSVSRPFILSAWQGLRNFALLCDWFYVVEGILIFYDKLYPFLFQTAYCKITITFNIKTLIWMLLGAMKIIVWIKSYEYNQSFGIVRCKELSLTLVGFETVTVMTMKSYILCDITPCYSVWHA
jgi:hypothetical protein